MNPTGRYPLRRLDKLLRAWVYSGVSQAGATGF